MTAYSDPDSVKVIEVPAERGRRFQLLVDDGVRAELQLHPDGTSTVQWAVYGPQQYHEARNVVLGLLDLVMLADSHQVDRLTSHSNQEKVRGKAKAKRKTK